MASDQDPATTDGEVIEPLLDGAGLSVGIVVARFNEFFTTHLLSSCRRELRRHGVADEDVIVAWVPGAMELPITARELIASRDVDRRGVPGMHYSRRDHPLRPRGPGIGPGHRPRRAGYRNARDLRRRDRRDAGAGRGSQWIARRESRRRRGAGGDSRWRACWPQFARAVRWFPPPSYDRGGRHGIRAAGGVGHDGGGAGAPGVARRYAAGGGHVPVRWGRTVCVALHAGAAERPVAQGHAAGPAARGPGPGGHRAEPARLAPGPADYGARDHPRRVGALARSSPALAARSGELPPQHLWPARRRTLELARVRPSPADPHHRGGGDAPGVRAPVFRRQSGRGAPRSGEGDCAFFRQKRIWRVGCSSSSRPTRRRVAVVEPPGAQRHPHQELPGDSARHGAPGACPGRDGPGAAGSSSCGSSGSTSTAPPARWPPTPGATSNAPVWIRSRSPGPVRRSRDTATTTAVVEINVPDRNTTTRRTARTTFTRCGATSIPTTLAATCWPGNYAESAHHHDHG